MDECANLQKNKKNQKKFLTVISALDIFFVQSNFSLIAPSISSIRSSINVYGATPESYSLSHRKGVGRKGAAAAMLAKFAADKFLEKPGTSY